MKKLFIVILMLPLFSIGQTAYNCGTPEYVDEVTTRTGDCTQTSNDENDYFRRYQYQKDLYPVRNSIIIPIDIYVWQKDNGTENYLDNQTNRDRLAQIITILDESFYNNNSTPSFQPLPNVIDYDSTKIRFRLENIYFERNSSCWGKGVTANYNDGVYLNNVSNSLYPESINNFKVHITGMETKNFSGYGTFPVSDFSHQHFIVTKNSNYDDITNTWTHDEYVNPVGLWGFAGHLAHEFGHNLNLYHTYNYEYVDGYDKCSEINPDYLDAVFGSSQNGSKVCPQSFSWSCDVNDPNNTCTNNIMGGTQSAGYFSPKQVQRMHRALSLLSIRKYAVAYNFDEDKYIEVSSHETWDFSTKLYNNLKVKSGATLTIQCKIQFVPEAKVVIEQGGKLILDGGTLTNEDYYNDFWQGIQVYGTTDKNQFPENNPTHQGLLIIKNGGTIENAHLAVSNWKVDDFDAIGGVIQSTGGVFRNNRRDVAFMSYQNYTPSYTSNYRNLSKFINTDFITDDDFIENGLPIQTHVTLWKVDGIAFTNCHFSNDITTNKNISSAPNRGIYSIDAGYKVLAGCSSIPPFGSGCPSANLQRSSFKGLGTAIEAVGAGTSNTITIEQTEFENNVWGVLVDEIDNASVNRNIIDVGDADYPLFWTIGAGIMASNSTGYIIEENTISSNLTDGVRAGVIVSNSGTDDNRIYKNTLTDLGIGTGGSGVNHNSNYPKGLQFLCNTFNNNQTAININSNLSNHGVRFYQGDFSPLKSAGNTFIDNTLDIDNSANSIVYMHNGGNTGPQAYQGLVTPEYTSNVNFCPTSFGGGIIILEPISLLLDSLNNELNDLTSDYTDLNFTYQSLIDDGNTEEFKDNIELNWSSDAWLLRDKLLASSPYLSSDVLLKAAGENVLPNGMLLEVLLANPDATKGERFIDKLKDETNNSFPEYMTDYVRGNYDSRTLRTDMEGQLSAIHSDLSKVRSWVKNLTKTKEEYTDEDRYNVAKLGNEIYNKVGLMDYYIEQGNFGQADSVLYVIENDKKYKEDLLLIENFGSYINFRSSLGNRNLAQLDSTEISYLQTLAEEKGRVAGYAQNILCFFYEICYEKELAFENSQAKSIMAPTQNNKEDLNDVLYNVKLYPNPAKDYTSIQWEIYDELKNARYSVVDLNGRELLKGVLSDNKGEQVIDTRKLGQGVYIIGIYNNEMKVNRKLIVVGER